MTAQYRPNEVTLEFGDGEYLFRLPLKKGIAELQGKRGAPIGTIYKRVYLGDFYAEDLIETCRAGLIGGGTDAKRANDLIDRYCDDWPLSTWHTHALAVLSACVEGYDDGSKKKAEGETTNGSPSQTPTETAPSPD